ncbi:MAG TPA: alpha/beta hydrolase [Myxococcales bacterium]|nr:alpha/beta hydrolase [Myxococcales bacterium]
MRFPASTAVLVAAVALACSSRSDRHAPTLALRDCQLVGQRGHGRIQARCGVLQVPEDWARPDGARLDLKVAVIPARGVADPAPVFALAGGPGQAATEQHVSMMAALSQAQRDRDVVLVDQRGTGALSTLKCDLGEAVEDPDALSNEKEAALVDRCLKEVRGDPRHYTTLDFVRDLDAAREALGYERIHLFGVSYGTRAALAYLRAYPDRARTAVLDSVAPPSMLVGDQMALTGQRALDLDFQRCAATSACATRFPDLPAALERVLDHLQRQPQPVKLRHPTTNAPVEVTLTRFGFARTAQFYSYTPELVGLLPLLIHGADGAADLSPVAAQVLHAQELLEGGLSRPLYFSVICAEDVPFFGEAPARAGWLPERSYLGDSVRSELKRVCARWPHTAVDRSFKEPVRSAVPVLLLSGEADPVTPPEFAEEARRALSHSVHVVVKGHGHNVSPRGCLPSLIGQLERTSAVEGLDVGCAADIAPAPMFLDFLGHEP